MATKKRQRQKHSPVPVGARETVEFRKANEAIGLRVSQGRLSLLSRKLFNVMVYRAQQLGVPGKDAPIESESAHLYFWISLAEVARDTAYHSNDTELLKTHLQELQNIRVVVEDEKQWTSERLVSSVKLVNPQGLHKKGGAIWFGFAFPPEVASMVMNPRTYTKLSIYYQTMLRSGASLGLYEICRRYATNPTKVTHIAEWEWWYGALTGNPIGETPPEYKYFKRDVLKPAIAEINVVTDISVALVEHKDGRRVVGLQFRIDQPAQTPLAFPAPPLIDGELIASIQRLGFTSEEAADLSVIHPEEKLKLALGKVAARMKSRNSSALDSPAAYFRWALKQAHSADREASPGTVQLTEAAEAPANKAIADFDRLNPEQQKEAVERFGATQEGRALLKLSKGSQSNTVVRMAAATWLARDRTGHA